jgi:hypothetical protein
MTPRAAHCQARLPSANWLKHVLSLTGHPGGAVDLPTAVGLRPQVLRGLFAEGLARERRLTQLAGRAVLWTPLDSAGQDQEHGLPGARQECGLTSAFGKGSEAHQPGRDRPAIERLSHTGSIERYGSSEEVPRNEGTWSPEPCAQVRILLGAQLDPLFSNIQTTYAWHRTHKRKVPGHKHFR